MKSGICVIRGLCNRVSGDHRIVYQEKKVYMSDNHREWVLARDSMNRELKALGFPEELGNEIAKNLGSPKAILRMTAYLQYVKPKSAELVVDEMLAICSEIAAWKEKKKSEEANARYNEILNYGLDT